MFSVCCLYFHLRLSFFTAVVLYFVIFCCVVKNRHRRCCFSGRDRTEKKLLGLSYLRLSVNDSTTVYDGLHELKLHKVSPPTHSLFTFKILHHSPLCHTCRLFNSFSHWQMWLFATCAHFNYAFVTVWMVSEAFCFQSLCVCPWSYTE